VLDSCKRQQLIFITSPWTGCWENRFEAYTVSTNLWQLQLCALALSGVDMHTYRKLRNVVKSNFIHDVPSSARHPAFPQAFVTHHKTESTALCMLMIATGQQNSNFGAI
jgi:hypothetical protein